MRFYEYEAREIVRRAGIPVTEFGFATTPEEAKAAAEKIDGPSVVKSQVLSGGRMKAGGVQFADTPDEAAAHTVDVLKIQIGGQMPRGVLVDTKAEVEQEYYAGVVWDGTAKQPVIIFSPVGGIDIEQVAEEQPDKVGRRHISNLRPLTGFEAKEVIASTGVTGSELNKLVPIVTKLAQLFIDYDMTLAEINPIGRLPDGSFIALDAHMDMENEARGRHKKLLAELGVGDDRAIANTSRGALAVTTNLNINFLRKPEPGDLIAEARLMKLGQRLIVGEAWLHAQGGGDAVAHATGTYSVPPPKG